MSDYKIVRQIHSEKKTVLTPELEALLLSDLRPGFRLDLLVAMKVMNFYLDPEVLEKITEVVKNGYRAANVTADHHMSFITDLSLYGPKKYSTDMNCAWDLISHIKSNKECEMIDVSWEVLNPWFCHVWYRDKKITAQSYDSASHAISLASLMSIGVLR